MINLIRKHFWLYLFEIIIALIIFSFGLEAFLIYAFITIIIKLDALSDYFRKLIRVFQVFNEIKLLSIIRKLKITDEEIEIVAEGEKREIGEKRWLEIEKEFSELMPK